MTDVRIYVTLTRADLQDLLTSGRLAAPPRHAVAVTPALRAARPGSDDEELEYAAWSGAAARAVSGGAPDRRIIGSADVPAAWVREQSGSDGDVTISEPLTRDQLASVHVDEQPGGPDADLLWFDVSELSAAADYAGS